MRPKRFLLPGAAALLLGPQLACIGGPGSAPPGPDVYTAGFVDSPDGSTVLPTYWKNQVKTTLPDLGSGGKATGIQVSGGSVYVCGGCLDGSKDIAMYWKDGVPVKLTDGSRQAFAEGLRVVDGDVYVVGYEDSVSTDPSLPIGPSVAMLWKNGVPTALTDGSAESDAKSVAVAGGDVYITGFGLETASTGPDSTLTAPVAKLWKNGLGTDLGDLSAGSGGSDATSVSVEGGHIYVAGHDSLQGSVDNIATCWKDGRPESFGASFPEGSFLVGAQASGGSFYAAGSGSQGQGDISVFWKDGAPTYLDYGTTGSYDLNALAVAGQHVYTAGVGPQGAMYWIDTRPYLLAKGDGDSTAWAIFVDEGLAPGF